MTTHTTIHVACDKCKTHGELWNEECQTMKVCSECMGAGWLLEDRLHIPSPNPNPEQFGNAEGLPNG